MICTLKTFNQCFLLLTIISLHAMASENYGVSVKMEEHSIVPDIVDNPPTELLEILYPSSATVNLGNELTPTQVKDIPFVRWNANATSFYTLLMTDPDAPSRLNPKFREVRHWLVVNIPGDKVEDGKTVYEYIGSGPPMGSGLHRYVFLVFKQSDIIKTDIFVSNRSREGRLSTSTRQLIAQYNLENPTAGNFYIAQYDDYVPVLQEQLGGAPKI